MNTKQFKAVVFTGDYRIGNRGFVKYRKINNRKRFESFLDKKYPRWTFYNFWYYGSDSRYTVKR